ncbi:uncharacterized protein LOC128133760 [Lactuca sativa]|uniref:uncharacterized protein LOC128133760 n=1 Tax=Lactuca sativa TaxID=4236 RepID=UPI0022AFC2DF|nr:uncharacterized protein LOC128133760 [Lactuca sativa]
MMLSFGIWNIRGVNLAPKQKEIKNLIKENNLSLLAVLESQVCASKLDEKCDKIFGSWKWVANNRNKGNTTRIIVGWNSNWFDVNLIDLNDQVIHCKISFPSNNKYVFCSFVYAANNYIDRRVLWSSLKHFKDFVCDDPWIIGGDFNVMLNLNESTVGSFRFSRGMEDFHDCINCLEIQDINCNGLNYTWNQKPRGKNGILKKLDRVMGNCRLFDDFPSLYDSFLPYGISDHSPLVIKIPLKMKFKVLPFKFSNVLTSCPELKVLVESHWNAEIKGIKMFQLVQKLKILKKPIRKLLRIQGHLSEKVDHCRKELEAVQADLDKEPFNSELRDLEAIFLVEFNKAYAEEESFLKQKAKVGWLKEGDSNSKYFHKVVKGKIIRNNIKAVMNDEGNWIEGEDVPKVFIEYFSKFLGAAIPCAEINNPHSLFSKKLDLVQAVEMVKVVTDEEIKNALFDIDDDKAPGPDGFSAKFFKSMWIVVGNDFCQAVKEFFCNGQLLKEVNATVIALIPKIDTPGKVSDYRPISCCSVIYKCISKIIVGRIRNHLCSIVSDNQSAFIPGRSIVDNILLSQELVKGYHRDRGFSRCDMKVDIQKAYDTVNWSFLQDILFFFGFHPVMIKWIMSCVSTPSYMLSINGTFHGFFEGKRGLRQGCPLSPYLFTLVMEIFNLIIQRRIRNEKMFKYHWSCKKQKITHLCFADDLMIFCHGNKASARVVKEALDEFAGVAGLLPNLAKSHIFFGNVKDNIKNKILRTLSFVEGKLPMRYLGLPLISTRLFIKYCKRLVDKVRKRIGDWKNKFLSYAGRLQLISSILFSLPVYWASSMLIPISTIKEIEKMMKNFLWNHDETKKGRAKVAWSSICKPVNKGGLGLRSLRVWNKAILSKRIWLIISEADSIWVKWTKINLLKGRSFWDIEKKNGLSWSWRNLIKLKDVVRVHFCNKIGDGARTFMWFDDWHPLGPFSYVLSPREISQAGFNISNKVKDVMVDDSWFWPGEWCDLIPQLRNFNLPVLDSLISDKVMWRNKSGKMFEFSIKKACEDLADFGLDVSWVHLVWFKHRIPRHSFILWLAIQERLMTQDRMRFWDKNKNLNCVLCNDQSDSHSHLFFECPFSTFVWKAVIDRVEIKIKSHSWMELIEELQGLLKGKSIQVFIVKIAFAASVYYVWKERNIRLFRKGKNEGMKVVLNIFEDIRLKLIGLKSEFLGFDNEVKRKWGVPMGKENHDFLMIKGFDGYGFSNFPLKIALLVGLIPIFWRNFPLEVVFLMQMGFIPIIGCFPPWQLGVSTSVVATASLISKWWDNYPSIPGIGYLFLKLYHIQVGCFLCLHKNNHFLLYWNACMVIAIRFIPDFIGSFTFEVVLFLIQMGLIPIIGCFPPWQLGVSTSVGATASSISKWWDNHPVIPRIGYVFLKLYHKQVGCFLCLHKNNHFWILRDSYLGICFLVYPRIHWNFSFEVVNFLKQMGLIPVSWNLLPRQLGISTLVGATASSISKWWDFYPLIHWIGYVNLRLYHIWVGCFPCFHKNNHFWIVFSSWFYQVFNANRSIPVIIGNFTFDVDFEGSILNYLGINLQGYFWNIPIKKGIDGFFIIGVILKKSVSGLEFYDIEDCGFFGSMSSFFVRRWFTHQGQFWNFWFIPLEEFLKINWNCVCKKEFGEKLKILWKWWNLIGHPGFSNILSWNLKIFALANENIGKFLEDLIDNFRNCFKNFVKDIGLIFWSIWVFQVKIGKKFNNWFLEMDGKYCMKSKVQSSKLIAILGFIPVWRSLKFYDGLIDLVNDSLDLEVPWMFCKIDIIQTLDYLFEYEANFWDLVWWRFNGYLKIEDFEDFTRWKIFDMELIVYFFGSYVWFHILLWSWTWKWIGWFLLDRSFCPFKNYCLD